MRAVQVVTCYPVSGVFLYIGIPEQWRFYLIIQGGYLLARAVSSLIVTWCDDGNAKASLVRNTSYQMNTNVDYAIKDHLSVWRYPDSTNGKKEFLLLILC